MDRRLHVGGRTRTPGWEILDAQARPEVDHVCNASDLARFADDTFTEIYASHVVEHFDFTGALQATLREWHRVLQPTGTLSVSVPDLDVLAQLFTAKDKLTVADRFFVMQMMFGGHDDQYDYHYVGLNEEFLTGFLLDAGFTNIKRVQNLGLFDDTSRVRFKEVPISLNVKAQKPPVGAKGQQIPPART